MARGFKEDSEFSALLAWELYQITFDKYHVMFFFNNGWAFLNVAFKFAIRMPGSAERYVYEIYGEQKLALIDPILRKKVNNISVKSINQLDIEFENGYVLEIYDDPEICSWWAWGGQTEEELNSQKDYIGDLEPDLMSENEREQRRA